MKRILYLQYTNPAGYPPLEHSSRLLANAGWEILFLGVTMPGVEALRFPPHPGITVYQRPSAAAGWRQKGHYARFALWTMRWALRWRPSWVYASDLLACPAALLVSVLPGARVIYHEHDSPAPGARTRFLRFCLWARRRLAGRAELCVLPSVQRAELFAAQTAPRAKVVCVWNCPRQEEIPPARPADDGSRLVVLYHGSLVPARLPSTVLEALARLPEQVTLRVIGYETAGSSGYVRQLQEMACRLGIAGRVEFARALPRSELLTSCRQCDIGLALMPTQTSDLNLRLMVGASNKPFDYLACGLALLVSDLPDWRATYVTPGYGLACVPEDPASIAGALRWFLDHPQERLVMGSQGRQRVLQEWNYERQFGPVLVHLNGTA